jgi:prepilin-type N-terminal cleavage/methylation domain-containing protein
MYFMSSKRNKQRNSKKGFTLIEMLVSVGLFTIVMTIALSVILSIVDGNKKAQAINSVVDNLNSSIDSMVRDMKTGLHYTCTGGVPLAALYGYDESCSPTTSIDHLSFVSTITGSEHSVEYLYVAAAGNEGGYIEKIDCPALAFGDSTTCLQPTRITAPEINITDMRMYATSPAPQSVAGGATTQPGVFIIISGTAQVNPQTLSDFHLQTYVTQRVLNI